MRPKKPKATPSTPLTMNELRTKSLTPSKRSTIASQAAKARWSKRNQKFKEDLRP